MSGPEPPDVRVGPFVRRWIDTIAYALVVATLSIVGALVVSVATGGELARANVFLFIIGWGLLAYATFLMWPSSPADLEEQDISGQSVATSTRVQSVSRSLPPVRWINLPSPQQRMAPRHQLFVAALVVLILSFLAESWLGIG